MKISSMSDRQLTDLLGSVNTDKNELLELEKRIKAQLQKRVPAGEKSYGEHFTVRFLETSRSSFQKDEFVRVYGQKEYDRFLVKKPEIRTEIKPVDKQPSARNEHVLRINVNGFGQVTAGKT